MPSSNERVRWRYKNEPAYREKAKLAAKRGKAKRAHKGRMHARFKKYGITEEEYNARLKKQNFCCAVCRTPDPGRGKGWNVDHDHQTGKIRGLLCVRCNFMLGHAMDNPVLLRAGAAYLEA